MKKKKIIRKTKSKPKVRTTKPAGFVVKEKGKNIFWPSDKMKQEAWVSDPAIYEQASQDPLIFWAKYAQELTWFKPWKKIYEEKLPFFKWFLGGKINACYNCLDRHMNNETMKNKIALVWVPEPTEEPQVTFTYEELYKKVNKMANVLLRLGIHKGDVVSIYLPMIPEIMITMLACSRIGAIHSVVFSAFSAEALKTRLNDAGAKLLVTADGYFRRGKLIELKKSADEAVRGTKVKKVLVINRASNQVTFNKNDVSLQEELEKAEDYCKPSELDSEHPLFILYTSGTTGTPKGIVHTTGGYLTQVYLTAKWNFNLHPEDIIWCTADIGWITGHSYVCYGPLMNGVTTLMYEGSPDFPSPSRFWQIIDQNKVSVFYTAPTALRMFVALGEKYLKPFNLSSLKILGTVGEPIDEATWLWYFNKIGKGRCPIIDTWWQTETGGTLINSLPGIGPFIPSLACRCFPGTKHIIVNEKGELLENEHGYLVQTSPFAPGMLRNVWKNNEMYKEKYWAQYENMYFTGDGAIEKDIGNLKLFRITGRVDDVIKVAGHRISTAELENALDKHPAVRESAISSKEDNIKGEVPIAFVILEQDRVPSEQLKQELIAQIDKEIGPIARPSEIYFVKDLPKTRSGKIMRRILKALLKHELAGDTTTLMNPECVEEIEKVLG
jgi:acetyl-CoA synthetase